MAEVKVPQGCRSCKAKHLLPEHHIGTCGPGCREGVVVHFHKLGMPAKPARGIAGEIILSEEELERISARRGMKSRRSRRSKKYMAAEMRSIMPVIVPRGAVVEGVPVVVEE